MIDVLALRKTCYEATNASEADVRVVKYVVYINILTRP
jgi:hypothetical protein